ncbi:MAG: RNA polymerase sigma factor [Myxococcota bacterium]
MDEPGWSHHARRAQAGDRAALAALAAAVWPWVRRWALLELADRSLAEDASQEALVRMIRHLGTWTGDRPFTPWLHAVVRNAARDQRAKQPEVREPTDRGADPDASDLDRALDLSRTAERALAAFDQCTPRQRQLLDLCDRQGHTPSEAAVVLGIAAGTARALLHQGRATIRAEVLRGTDVVGLLNGVNHGPV